MVFSLGACGLPGAAARSTGNLAKSLSGLIGPAAAAAAL